MDKRALWISLSVFFYSLAGCAAVQDIGSGLKYNVLGEYYLQRKEYQRGRKVFHGVVKSDYENEAAHYYYGRFLMAEGKAEEALNHLVKAAAGNPKKSDYHFWLGLAFGELGRADQERKSYNMALQLDSENISALTYMGNSLLRGGKFKKALSYYQKTLEIWPYSPQALYNRAVILRHLKRVPEEKLAWLHYLDAYPSGRFARLATERLNSLGDHSYRNHRLGIRTITLSKIYFVPFTSELADGAFSSLDLVGASMSNMSKGTLNVIVYQQNNLELAKKRALSIRDYLFKQFPNLKNNQRIRTSWFDVPERRVVLRRNLRIAESVQFFLTDYFDPKKNHK